MSGSSEHADGDVLEGELLLCAYTQGGCGERFQQGGRAYILHSGQLHKILASDGELRFTDFDHQSGLFCSDCLQALHDHGGMLQRHSSRGDYIVSFNWLIKRTEY